MTVGVDGDGHPEPARGGVSGTVVQALLARVRHEAGDPGVAQALALAAEERSFPALGASSTRIPLADAGTLFAAGALVTGDGAIGLHVGEELLWTGDDPAASRLAPLGSPEVAMRHIGALIEQFEGSTEALALEVGPGHALVQVSSAVGERQAHLCDLTRGLLSRLPVLFGGRPAQVAEHECAARGGRFCRYVLTWDTEGSASEPSETGGAVDLGARGVDADRSDAPGVRSASPHEPADEAGNGEAPTPGRTIRRDSDGRPVADQAPVLDATVAGSATGRAAPERRPAPEPSIASLDDNYVDSFDDPSEVTLDDRFDDDAPFGRDEHSEYGPGPRRPEGQRPTSGTHVGGPESRPGHSTGTIAQAQAQAQAQDSQAPPATPWEPNSSPTSSGRPVARSSRPWRPRPTGSRQPTKPAPPRPPQAPGSTMRSFGGRRPRRHVHGRRSPVCGRAG